MNLQRFLTVLLSLVCYQLSFAQLAPQAKAPLLEHMTEVNAQWETQSKYLPKELLATPVQFRSDKERISRHLQLVEFALRNKKTDLTNNSQRTALLELLNQYWNRGLYPINLYHKERTPYFIDHKSTACAVGYLIQKSGYEDFAARIAKENNYDNCLLLNTNKNIIEALNGNIFLVKDNVIKTPPLADGCLKGVIRDQLIEMISKSADYDLIETSIAPFELQKADEIFITNVIQGIKPVTKFRKKMYATEAAKKFQNKLNVKLRLD